MGIHDHPISAADVEHGRCRLCSANDMEAAVEKLAEDLWDSRRHGTLDDFPWADCGPHWQRIFQQFAETAVERLRLPR